MLEKPTPPTDPPSDSVQPSTEQDSSPSLDLSSTQIQPIHHPAATSSPQQERLSEGQEATESLDPEQESGPMLYLSESLQESLPTDAVVRYDPGEEISAASLEQSKTVVTSDSDTLQKEAKSEVVHEPLATQCGSTDPAAAEPSPQQHTKPKKDKFAMLKKLGLDPPPVVKLCPDDGAFVQLEPPELNPGECYKF